jgi:hypothetical protein
VLGAMDAAEDGAILLDPVTNHLATAVSANWRQCMDGTLECIERVLLPIHRHRECLVIVVAAYFALRHSRRPPGQDSNHLDLIGKDRQLCCSHDCVLGNLLGVIGPGLSLEDNPVFAKNEPQFTHTSGQPML